METLTVSRAKARFSEVTRRVIRSRKPVVVRTPAGLVQISAYDLPEEVTPAAPGSLRLTKAELKMQNTFGESL